MSPAKKGPQKGRRPPQGAGFGGANMAQLMRQAQKMQQQVEQTKAELGQLEVTGSAGGNLVTAVMSGSGELKSMTIRPEAVDPDDVETLQDLVVAAVRDAARAAAELNEQAVGPISGGASGLGLPGL